MASSEQIQGLLDKQAERIEKSMDTKIQSVTKAFKEEIVASNEALKKELIAMMDVKIAERISMIEADPSAMTDAAAPEGSQQVMKDITLLKERIAFFESRSNASTAPSEGIHSSGPAKRAKRPISEGRSNERGDPGSSDDPVIKFRPKDPSILVFSGKESIKKAEAILAIVAEASKKGISKEDMTVKGPGMGNSFTVKFKDKCSGYSTGKDAAEAVKNQYKKGESEYDNVTIQRGDGNAVAYSFSWDKSSTQALRETVLQTIWKEIRDATKPEDLKGEFEKYKGDGKVMFNYDVVVRVNVGVDGRYRLIWGSVKPLEKIGKSKCAIEALVAERFSSFSG